MFKRGIYLPGVLHTVVVKGLVRPYAKSVSKTPRTRGRLDRLIINLWRKI